MRAFIAIEIPHSLQEKMGSLQKELKKSGADVRWTKPEGVHLTLKFLGEINQEKVKKLIAKLKDDIPSFDPLKICLKGLGGFPNLNRPRVLWLGVEPAGQGLKQLQKEIEKSLQPLGFPQEGRDFKPHLTLGRVKSFQGQTALIRMVKDKENIELGEFTTDCYYLFQSILKPSGAEYHKIHKFMLRERD